MREIESSCYFQKEKGIRSERSDCETENDNSRQRVGGIGININGYG